MRRLLFLIVAALGLAQLAIQPPFEGMDETAHYSSILQMAETASVPLLGRATIASEVLAYQSVGPSPYDGRQSPDDAVTYRSYFAGPPSAVADAPSPPFSPSPVLNWQGQHPPLYYALLAPAAGLTAGMPLRQRLLVLRLLSFALALAGLYLAARANEHLIVGGGTITMLWPFLMPGWFPEMARLGNDSLALLLMSAAWLAFGRIIGGDERRRWWAAAGLALGLGCATKAFMVPVTLGCLALLSAYALRRRQWGHLALAATLAALPAAPWYVWLLLDGIPFTNDTVALAAAGGLWQGLRDHGSMPVVLRALLGVANSFVWGGTWSFARPHPLFNLPLGLGGLFVLSVWWRQCRAVSWAAMLPWAAILPMGLGLVHHCLIGSAIGLPEITGGWYLHVLVAPFALVAAQAYERLRPWSRRVLAVLPAYGAAYFCVLLWLQASLFAGCAYRLGRPTTIRLDGACLFDLPLVAERLSNLAYPGLAGLAALAAALAAPWAIRRLRG